MVAKLSDRVAGTYKPYSLYYNGDPKITATIDGVTVTGSSQLGTSASIQGSTKFSTLTMETPDFPTRNCLAYWEGDDSGGKDIYRILSRDKGTNANSKTMFYADADGPSILYHNGIDKLRTTSAGATVTGTLTADEVSVGDNEFINLGNSNDLQIYHNGNSVMKSSQGTMYIDCGGFAVRSGNASELLIRAFVNGGVNLYYNSSVKLQTTSAGGTLTGTWSGGGLSDERLKENIETRNGLDNILSLTGVDWDWKEDIDFDVEGAETSGFTAQNWAEVYPDQVSEVYPELPKPEPVLDEDGQPIEAVETGEPIEIDNTGRTDGRLQINRNLNSQTFDADVVEAIKALHSTIEALTARIEVLEG